MKKILLLVLCALLLLSCQDKAQQNEFVVSTYNMYLFFDGYDSGIEYSPFRLSEGYTYDVYKERVKLMSKYLSRHFSSSDVIVFQEVENSSVLKDILDAGLKKHGFHYYGVASSRDVFSVGYISKRPPVEMRIHSTECSRPILELLFSFGGEEISLFTLHAPSRLKAENEALRYELFSLLATLLKSNKGKVSVVLGDFNVDIREGEAAIASEESELSLSSAIVATKDSNFKEDVYFSPMLSPGEIDGDGTYFYGGKWSFLDNVLISREAFDNKGIEYKGCRIVAPFEAKDTSGFPLRFDIKTRKGYSDHFALTLHLRYN